MDITSFSLNAIMKFPKMKLLFRIQLKKYSFRITQQKIREILQLHLRTNL